MEAPVTTSGLKIIVCDDDPTRVEKWQRRLAAKLSDAPAGHRVEALKPHVFAGAFRALLRERSELRGAAVSLPADQADRNALEIVRSADVLVVDYDLSPDGERVASGGQDDSPETLAELSGSTGEDFAYLLRVTGGPRTIAIVNQRFQRSTFDLTLQRFAGSRGDVNLQAPDLDSNWLWFGGEAAYRPWSWPVLTSRPALASAREDLIEDLSRPVLDALGLADERHLGSLARSQLDPLGEEDPTQITFHDLVHKSDLGLTAKDRGGELDEPQIRAIAAAAVGLWLEQVVLPGQNVIVDAPHLAQRYPGILTDPTDLELWQALTGTGELGNVIKHEALKPAEVRVSKWLSRDCWSLPLVGDLRLGRGSTPSEFDLPVFCEDSSRFVPLDAATEVATSVHGPYRQRFVEEVDGCSYVPLSRMS